jgi:hypothetical protein
MKWSNVFGIFGALALAGLLATPALASSGAERYIPQNVRELVILGFSLVMIAVTIGVYFKSGARQENIKGLWFTAITFSVLAFLGIGVIWYMVSLRSADEDTPKSYSIVLNDADVAAIKDTQIANSKVANVEAPIFIPTGVFIQSLEFSSANNLVVTGYVWQRYSNDIPADISRGFVMPEGDQIEGTEVYRVKQGNEEVIGWYIQTTLRQTFDYARYPFDRQDIWLRLLPKDFARNVILVPDFTAYGSKWDFYSRLGLEGDFVLERLALERTYFNYHYNSYTTNFGINNYVGQNNFPELYFNVGVRREVLDAFVAYLIPMIILILMAFGVQFIVTQISEKMSMYGISTIGLIAYFASLFFIGILAHLDIRRTLNAPGVVYLEYFYFTLYTILLLQTVNAIIFTVSDKFHFIEYEDNLYPKVLFFPVTLGIMFVVTAVIFF